ncbi:MAG: hypothetical protein ACUZ8H_12155 [Candidatus Anammoxibacter sp.]
MTPYRVLLTSNVVQVSRLEPTEAGRLEPTEFSFEILIHQDIFFIKQDI